MGLRKSAPEAAPALPGATQVTSAPASDVPTATLKVDYKAEERARIQGQVRMHCIIAALASPAGPAFAPTAEAYEAWVKKLADIAYEYTFQGESK